MSEGLPEDRHLEYLRDICLIEENITFLSASLRDKGCALHQAGGSPVVTRLLNSLHRGALSHLVHTSRRQARLCARPVYLQHGIRHGPLSSSSETHVAQHVLGVRLYDNLPFWVSRSAKFLPSVGKTKIPCGSFTSDVTFVDDHLRLLLRLSGLMVSTSISSRATLNF